jgi:hypothetical protein
MTTTRALLTVVVLSFAVTQSILAQAPVPRALTDARTAYLVNAGAGQGTFDDLAKALQKWGRFTLVE